MFFYNMATGIFSALGDSKTPFIFLVVSSVQISLLIIIFVKAFNMGIAGVAWATFICQGISAVLAVIVSIFKIIKNKSPTKMSCFFIYHTCKLLKLLFQVFVSKVLSQ